MSAAPERLAELLAEMQDAEDAYTDDGDSWDRHQWPALQKFRTEWLLANRDRVLAAFGLRQPMPHETRMAAETWVRER